MLSTPSACGTIGESTPAHPPNPVSFTHFGESPPIALNVRSANTHPHSSSNTPFKTTGYCSAARAGYFFDPRSVLNLPVTLTSTIDPKYENALPKLQTLSRYTFGLYIAAIALSTLTLLVSILAFQRRLGSLLAALISAATCLVTLAASSAATVLFAVEMGVVKALAEKQYSAGGLADDQSAIRAELGRHALAATWIAGACSIVAFVFWLLTACCCKGRVGGEGQKVRVQKEAVYEPRGARSY